MLRGLPSVWWIRVILTTLFKQALTIRRDSNGITTGKVWVDLTQPHGRPKEAMEMTTLLPLITIKLFSKTPVISIVRDLVASKNCRKEETRMVALRWQHLSRLSQQTLLTIWLYLTTKAGYWGWKSKLAGHAPGLFSLPSSAASRYPPWCSIKGRTTRSRHQVDKGSQILMIQSLMTIRQTADNTWSIKVSMQESSYLLFNFLELTNHS